MDSIFSLQNISYSYPSGSVALDGINISFPENKKIVLLGGNGAGKTTLLLHLNGILKPQSGNIFYNNHEMIYSKKYLKSLRKEVGFIFYESDHQIFAPTVFEEISIGLANYSKDINEICKKVNSVLSDFSLNEFKDKIPHCLSSGQKKLVTLAAVAALEPKVFVCDEPCAGLDPKHSDMIYSHFDLMIQKGATIIISTHNVEMAYQWADYAIIMHNGKILEAGIPEDLFLNKDVLEKANLRQPKIIELYQKMKIPHNITITKSIDDFVTQFQNK